MGSPRSASPASTSRAIEDWVRGSDGDALLVRRLAQDVLEPLPPEGVTEKLAVWRRAVKAGADLCQHVRCGHVSLLQVISRLTEGRQSQRGDGAAAGEEEGTPWSDLLEECGKNFVEHCAEMVEACQGTPPSLAPRILGGAIRLAETLGSTGPLLHAIDSELRCLEERFRKLEQLYNVSLRRAEAIAGQMPILEEKVTQATKGREELRSQCRELKQVLSKAEKRRQLAETKATELAKELREVQQQQQQQQHQHQLLRSQGSPSPSSSSPRALQPPTSQEAFSTARQRREAWQGTRVVNYGASSVGQMTPWGTTVGHSPTMYSSEGPTTARSLPPSLHHAIAGEDSAVDSAYDLIDIGRGGGVTGSARTGRFGSGASRWSLPASYSASLPVAANPTPHTAPGGRPPPWVSRPLSSESLDERRQSEIHVALGGSASIPVRGTSFAVPGAGMESICSTPRSPDDSGGPTTGAAAIAAAAARAAAASSVPVIDGTGSGHEGSTGCLHANNSSNSTGAGGHDLNSSGCGGVDAGSNREHGQQHQQQHHHHQQQQQQQQDQQLHHNLFQPSTTGQTGSGPSLGSLTRNSGGPSSNQNHLGYRPPPPVASNNNTTSASARDFPTSMSMGLADAGLGSRLTNMTTNSIVGTTASANTNAAAKAYGHGADDAVGGGTATSSSALPPAATEPPILYFGGAGEVQTNSARRKDVWGMDGSPAVTASPSFMPPSKSLPVGVAHYDRFYLEAPGPAAASSSTKYCASSSYIGDRCSSGGGGCGGGGPMPIPSAFDLDHPAPSDALDCGRQAAKRLPDTDPLSGPARSAFSSLASLVEEAFEMYPSLGRPQVGEQVLNGDSAAEGVKGSAASIKIWASQTSNLAATNPSMAASIRTLVAHLETLMSLMSRSSSPTLGRPSQVNGRPPAYSTKF